MPNLNLFMSELDKFRAILIKKYLFDIKKKNGKYWIKQCDAFKMLEIDWIPDKYITIEKKSDGNIVYLLDDIMDFVKNSVNDASLCDYSKNKHLQKALWRNCHYVVDYHKPLNWFNSNTIDEYSDQVKILTEIVENILDKISLRGMNEFELERCTNFKFRVDYFVQLPIPLIIDIIEKKTNPKVTFKADSINDFEKEQLAEIKFRVLQIDATQWDKNKKMYCSVIEDHIKKFNAIKFLENIIMQSNELRDIIEELGHDISLSCCSNDEFKFPLSKCLKKFGVQDKSSKYSEIMSQFFDKTDACPMTHPYYHQALSDYMRDDLSDMSDSSSDESNKASKKSKKNKNAKINSKKDNNFDDTLVSKTKRVLFIRGIDYLFDDDEYHLNMATLIQVAVTSGERRASIFIEKSLKLMNYISAYGKSAYEKLLKDMTLSLEDRKKMFNQSSQEKDKELIECKKKIKEFESYVNIKDNHKAIKEEVEKKNKHIIEGYKNTIIELQNEITRLKNDIENNLDNDTPNNNYEFDSEEDARKEMKKSLRDCAKRAKVKAGTLMTKGKNYLDDGFDGFMKYASKK